MSEKGSSDVIKRSFIKHSVLIKIETFRIITFRRSNMQLQVQRT